MLEGWEKESAFVIVRIECGEDELEEEEEEEEDGSKVVGEFWARCTPRATARRLRKSKVCSAIKDMKRGDLLVNERESRRSIHLCHKEDTRGLRT